MMMIGVLTVGNCCSAALDQHYVCVLLCIQFHVSYSSIILYWLHTHCMFEVSHVPEGCFNNLGCSCFCGVLDDWTWHCGCDPAICNRGHIGLPLDCECALNNICTISKSGVPSKKLWHKWNDRWYWSYQHCQQWHSFTEASHCNAHAISWLHMWLSQYTYCGSLLMLCIPS